MLPIKVYDKVIHILSRTGLGKYSFVRSSVSYLRSLIRPSYAKIDGHKMFLDALDTLHLLQNGVYEEFETECVKKIIH